MENASLLQKKRKKGRVEKVEVEKVEVEKVEVEKVKKQGVDEVIHKFPYHILLRYLYHHTII